MMINFVFSHVCICKDILQYCQLNLKLCMLYLYVWSGLHGCRYVRCVCVSPDEGSGYGQNGAYEPSRVSDDQRLEVLPQPKATTQILSSAR